MRPVRGVWRTLAERKLLAAACSEIPRKLARRLEARLPATSLRLETGGEHDRSRLVAEILNKLGPAIDEWAS